MSPRSAAPAVAAGELPGHLPCLSFGAGPPVVILPGLDGRNASPTGVARRFEVRRYRPFAERFTVTVVRRPPGLAAGCTMADLAADLARALPQRYGGPVDVVGISTGGSVALQLAADHPEVVRRLVIWASACRLSGRGRAVQRAEARFLRAGHQRRAQATSARAVAATPAGGAVIGALTWLLSQHLAPGDVEDMVRMIRTEDVFDAAADLGRITAPTLVVGGERDAFYGADQFRRTAAGVAGARLVLLPRAGHGASVVSREARREIVEFLSAP
jgi:pimeloyl-ACP methyl ester carboxylesterase